MTDIFYQCLIRFCYIGDVRVKDFKSKHLAIFFKVVTNHVCRFLGLHKAEVLVLLNYMYYEI
jgi:hypothetical protein